LIGQVSLLMLAAFERIQACVGGDFIKPGAHRSPVETRKAAPRAQISFLHQIFCFVQGAKHPVAMQSDLAPQRFGQPFEGLLAVLLPGWFHRRHSA
jgi:hypothetical protein